MIRKLCSRSERNCLNCSYVVDTENENATVPYRLFCGPKAALVFPTAPFAPESGPATEILSNERLSDFAIFVMSMISRTVSMESGNSVLM